MYRWIKHIVFITLLLGTAVSHANPVGGERNESRFVDIDGVRVEVSTKVNIIVVPSYINVNTKYGRNQLLKSLPGNAVDIFRNKNNLAEQDIILFERGMSESSFNQFMDIMNSENVLQEYYRRILRRVRGIGPRKDFMHVLKREMGYQTLSRYGRDRSEEQTRDLSEVMQEADFQMRRLDSVLNGKYNLLHGKYRKVTEKRVSTTLGVVRFFVQGTLAAQFTIASNNLIPVAQAYLGAAPAAAFGGMTQKLYPTVSKIMSHNFNLPIVKAGSLANGVFHPMQYLVKKATFAMLSITLLSQGVAGAEALFSGAGAYAMPDGMMFKDYLPWLWEQMYGAKEYVFNGIESKAPSMSGMQLTDFSQWVVEKAASTRDQLLGREAHGREWLTTWMIAASYGVDKTKHEDYYHVKSGEPMHPVMSGSNFKGHIDSFAIALMIFGGQYAWQLSHEGSMARTISEFYFYGLTAAGYFSYLNFGRGKSPQRYQKFRDKMFEAAVNKCKDCARGIRGAYEGFLKGIKSSTPPGPARFAGTCGAVFAAAY